MPLGIPHRHSHPAPFPGHFCHCSLKDEQIFSKTHLKEKRGPNSADLLKQINLISMFSCLCPPQKLEVFLVVLGLHLGKSNRTWIYKERRNMVCSTCLCFSFSVCTSSSSSSFALTTAQTGDLSGLQRERRWREETHEHQET